MNDDDTSDYRGNSPRTTAGLMEWHARAPREEALEPELPIVDAHHHVFGTIDDSHYYRLDDLAQDIRGGHDVIGTVYVEAFAAGWRQSGPEALRPVGEVEMISELTRSTVPHAQGLCQIAAAIVSHADLRLGDGVAEVLQAELVAGGGRLRGVRHMAAHDEGTVGRYLKYLPQRHLLGDAAFRRGFAHLERFGLSFDAWLFHHQLAELTELADTFPNTPIVVNHTGGLIGVAEFRKQRASAFARWAHELRALAARPNVWLKVGGLGMPIFGFCFEHLAKPASSAELARVWQPCIDVCIDTFGPQRCMFESNFPVDRQSCGYNEVWNAFKIATRSLSTDERRDMFYRTACRAYRLPELERIGDQARLAGRAPPRAARPLKRS